MSTEQPDDLDIDLEDEIETGTEKGTEADGDELTVEPVLAPDIVEQAPDIVEPTPAQAARPLTDAEVAQQAALHVEDASKVPQQDPDIFKIPFRQISRSIQYTQRMMDEIERQSQELLRRRKQIEDKLTKISHLSASLERAQQYQERFVPRKSINIRQHLDTIFQTRMDKAMAAKAFLGGLPASEVLKAINPKSKLDQVLGARRGGHGDGRRFVSPVR